MKKIQLISMILAVLMVLVCFVSCGEPKETKADETTAAAATTKAATTAQVTTKAATTKAATTTKEVTTAAPVTGLDDPIKDTAHNAASEHKYATVPTFTAYSETKEDGTIGYYAYHCVYEGCTAIKDNLVYPTLINMDFDGFTGSFADYVKQDSVKNVAGYTECTNGNIANDMYNNKGNVQVIIQDLANISDYDKFVMSFDIKTGSIITGTGLDLKLPSFGRVSDSTAPMYYYGFGSVGRSVDKVGVENTDCLYSFINFTPFEKLEGFTFKTEQWYHFEYVITMAREVVQISGKSVLPSTIELYATEMARNADGTMVRTGEREHIGTQTGMEPVNNGLDSTAAGYRDKSVIMIFNDLSGTDKKKTLVACMDNFAVYLPGVAEQ